MPSGAGRDVEVGGNDGGKELEMRMRVAISSGNSEDMGKGVAECD